MATEPYVLALDIGCTIVGLVMAAEAGGYRIKAVQAEASLPFHVPGANS